MEKIVVFRNFDWLLIDSSNWWLKMSSSQVDVVYLVLWLASGPSLKSFFVLSQIGAMID